MWESLYFDLDVKNHIDLLEERGMDASHLRRRYEALANELPEEQRRDSDAWAQLEADILAADEAWETGEPSELDAILPARPDGRVDAYPTGVPEGDALAGKVLGGWIGRTAGCILGKPVECLMREPDSRGKLRELLRASGDWPMADYIRDETLRPYLEKVRGPSWFGGVRGSLRGHINGAPSDDDTNYTVVALRAVERYGREFTPDNLLDTWLGCLPYRATCTAEKIAYRNRVMGLAPPRTATFANTYREWIGAQIRADLYGYVSPGRPADAARLAFQDAAASHTENGIYGAMWVAACIAAAYCESDPAAVVLRGLEQVPADCRLAEHVRRTVEVARRNGDDCEATFDDIARRVGHYHCVHTVNNACLVAAGLVHGRGDYGRTICVAVMGGLDTDCNGATAGSIAGVMLSEPAIPDSWKAPLHDTLHTSVAGESVVKLSDLARRTLKLL